MSSTGGKIEIVENIKTKAAEISLAFNAYLALMVFIILIIVIVILYKFNKQFNEKVAETFSKLTNRQMIMAGVKPDASYRFAPRADRLGNYWNKFRPTDENLVKKTLQIYADQYIKKIPNGDIAVINEKIASYLAKKEVKEVVNVKDNKIEEIVVTEQNSNKIDPKIAVTENGEIVAKEVIVEPTTQEVIANAGETVGQITDLPTPPAVPSEPQTQEEAAPEKIKDEEVIKSEAEAAKQEVPANMTDNTDVQKNQPVIDTTGALDKQTGNDIPSTEGQSANTESWAPSRGMNRKAFEHLTWGSSHRNMVAETQPKPIAPESFGLSKLVKRKGKY